MMYLGWISLTTFEVWKVPVTDISMVLPFVTFSTNLSKFTS